MSSVAPDLLLHRRMTLDALSQNPLISSCLSLLARFGEARRLGALAGESLSGSTPETGYYVNPKVQALACMSDGVRLPSGDWTRVAGTEVPRSQAESLVRRLFPSLIDRTLYVFTLQTDLDVDDFERCFGLAA